MGTGPSDVGVLNVRYKACHKSVMCYSNPYFFMILILRDYAEAHGPNLAYHSA